jgi:hypothetical protein
MKTAAQILMWISAILSVALAFQFPLIFFVLLGLAVLSYIIVTRKTQWTPLAKQGFSVMLPGVLALGAGIFLWAVFGKKYTDYMNPLLTFGAVIAPLGLILLLIGKKN